MINGIGSSTAMQYATMQGQVRIGGNGGGTPPSPPPDIDTDGNGALSKDEFSNLISKITEMSGQQLDAQSLFSKYDTDGDGSLSSSDMKAMMDDGALPKPPVQGPGGMAGIQSGAGKIDTNDDGALSKDEFSAFINALSEKSGQKLDADALFSQYDSDGNGSLSMDDLKKMTEDGALPPPPVRQERAAAMYQGASQMGQMQASVSLLNTIS